ncbi:hypothetical protein DR73_1542 [Enterobacteriaceae bacterium ATCC 29904]|nr:hypothetical protein DR73_1542 [Enterobacteriaceae bacterium ATCC 29904]
MNDSLNNKELVAGSHQFAKAMSSDSPIIDMAKIVSRLAERLDYTTAALREMTKQRDALAAENTTLKTAFNPDEIPDDAVNAFADTAIMDSDWDESGSWSYVENDTDVIRAVLDALKPETPATDASLAEVRAQAIMNALESLDGVFDTDCVMEANGISYEDAEQRTAGALAVNKALANVAFELRKGASA